MLKWLRKRFFGVKKRHLEHEPVVTAVSQADTKKQKKDKKSKAKSRKAQIQSEAIASEAAAALAAIVTHIEAQEDQEKESHAHKQRELAAQAEVAKVLSTAVRAVVAVETQRMHEQAAEVKDAVEYLVRSVELLGFADHLATAELTVSDELNQSAEGEVYALNNGEEQDQEEQQQQAEEPQSDKLASGPEDDGLKSEEDQESALEEDDEDEEEGDNNEAEEQDELVADSDGLKSPSELLPQVEDDAIAVN